MKNILKRVHLHQSLFWPGMHGADSTTISDQKIKDLEMWDDGTWVYFKSKGKVIKSHVTNVRSAEPILEDDSQETDSEETVKKRGRPFKI